MLSSQIYHESSEQFDEGTKKDEGVLMYTLRHIYLVAAVFAGIGVVSKVYALTFTIKDHYEDYLDQILFEGVKRMRGVGIASGRYKVDLEK